MKNSAVRKDRRASVDPLPRQQAWEKLDAAKEAFGNLSDDYEVYETLCDLAGRKPASM